MSSKITPLTSLVGSCWGLCLVPNPKAEEGDGVGPEENHRRPLDLHQTIQFCSPEVEGRQTLMGVRRGHFY